MYTQNFKSKHAQAGFTLIELIVVIVILGVLAATALPKFADLGGDARVAKMQAAQGAMKAAAATFHGQWLAAGSPASVTPSTILQEGVPIEYTNGFPSAAGILVSAGLSSADYPATSGIGSVTITADASTTRTGCSVTYTEATAALSPVVALGASTTTCK